VLLTVCEALTVYVPAPPEPDPNAVIIVPSVTPEPSIVWPICKVPLVTAETVIVVPDIDAVTIAGAAVELAGVPDGIVFAHNAWITPATVPTAAKSPTDITDVKLTNPNTKIAYGQVDAANYAPLAAYSVGVIDGAPTVDYDGVIRNLWTVGALEFVEDVVEPPPPDDELVQLVIEASFSPTEAAQLRALLKDRAISAKLV